jgi:hypothetical protein
VLNFRNRSVCYRAALARLVSWHTDEYHRAVFLAPQGLCGTGVVSQGPLAAHLRSVAVLAVPAAARVPGSWRGCFEVGLPPLPTSAIHLAAPPGLSSTARSPSPLPPPASPNHISYLFFRKNLIYTGQHRHITIVQTGN